MGTIKSTYDFCLVLEGLFAVTNSNLRSSYYASFDNVYLHRACVGIKVEPKDDADWFCRACIARKQSDQTEGKKKKRKKKDKDKRDN